MTFIQKNSKSIIIACVICVIALIGAGYGVSVLAKDSIKTDGVETMNPPRASAWVTRCADAASIEMPDKRGLCEIKQSLNVATEGGMQKRLLEFAVGYPKDKKDARGILILPLGIFVGEGLEIKIDDHTPFKFKLRYCDATGCYAYLTLTEPVLNTMRAGKTMAVRFKSIKGQNLDINLSLKGFTDAMKGIS